MTEETIEIDDSKLTEWQREVIGYLVSPEVTDVLVFKKEDGTIEIEVTGMEGRTDGLGTEGPMRNPPKHGPRSRT